MIIIIIIIIMIPFASFASKFLASTTKSQQNGCWLTVRTLPVVGLTNLKEFSHTPMVAMPSSLQQPDMYSKFLKMYT